jgi:iron complex transport system ATP-binding protein
MMPAAAALLRCRGVHVAHRGQLVLHGIDLDLAPGWTAIVGPNGAGKSTLLRALAGLQPITQGEVWVGSDRLACLAATERARRIGWLAQGGQFSGDLTVRQTVELGRIAQRGLLRPLDADDARAVADAMQQTGCAAWADRPLSALSGGERQRALLARVLATEAPVLLLDEPTTHLDAPHQVALARLFGRLARGSTALGGPRALVTVLHDLAIALHADQVVVLQDGSVAASGPAADTHLHRALEQVFEQAVSIHPGPRRAVVRLAIDEA